MGSYRTVLYKLNRSRFKYRLCRFPKGGPNSLPDKDHEGHSGRTIPQIASNINGWLNTHNPDVVFLWIGGNDMFFGGGVNAKGLSDLIDQIFAVKPNITLFVADYYPWPEMVTQYNAVIPGIVQQKPMRQEGLLCKAQRYQFNRYTDLSGDNLHLSETDIQR